MALGCFSGLWCSRQPPSPSDDGIVSQVLAPTGANQPNPDSPSGNGGVRDDTTIEVTHSRSPTNPSNADIPVPASTPDHLPSSTGVLAPAPTEAQPTGPHSPKDNVDISVPAHAEEVPSVSPSSCHRYRLDPVEAKKHIDRIGRFRVLVIGRANAGKTTILQRVCNTTDQPEVFSAGGEKLDATVVQGSLTRGHHNIEDELVFQSNPGFVFHDSCGFEAGSEEQFQMMKKFVMDHAKTAKLDKRIHAIWFCIPLNESHRFVMAAEKKFFDECDTGHVPVIVLLTKAETLRLEAVQQLMNNNGFSLENAVKEAPEVERGMVNDCLARVRSQLGGLKFPPHDYVILCGMEQQGADCACLLQCTGNALNEEGLQELLISTQQSNLGLCMEFAINKSLKSWMEETKAHQIEPTSISYTLSVWFPFRTHPQLGGLPPLLLPLHPLLHPLLQQPPYMDNELVPSIHAESSNVMMPTLAESMQCSMKNIAEHGIGSVLVFEYLYFLLQGKEDQHDLQEVLNLAVKEYETSGVHANVHKCITAAFQEHGEDVEILCPIFVDIAKENQMSKNLT